MRVNSLTDKLKEGDSVKVHLLVLDRDRDSDARTPEDLENALRGEDVLAYFKAAHEKREKPKNS